MSVTITPSGGSGEGPQELTFEMGKNQTRAEKTYTLSLKQSGSSSVADTLTLTQEYTELKNNATGGNTVTKISSSSTQSITFAGVANGKYLKCESESEYLTLVSCTEDSDGTAHSIGTIYTQVSNFEGGSSEYAYTITATLAANAPSSTNGYSIAVTTADSTSPSTFSSERYIVKVTASDVAITSVDLKFVDDDYSALPTGSTRAAYVNVTPTNATIASYSWTRANNVISLTPSYDTCVVIGNRDGGSVVSVTVTDTLGNTRTDDQAVVVRDPGTITLYDLSSGSLSDSSITILSMAESATAGLVLYNIDTSQGFTFSVTGGSSWIFTGSSSVDYINNPNNVTIGRILQNNSEQDGRTGKVQLSAKDLLGNVVYSNELTIFQEYNSPIACTSMLISGSDSDSPIYNSENKREYSITYNPTNTTQKACHWQTLTDTQGNPVDSSIAYISNDPDETNNNKVTIYTRENANNQTLILRAINAYDSSVIATRQVKVKHYQNPEVVITGITGSSVELNHEAQTNETPKVSFTNSTFASLRIWKDANKTIELGPSSADCIFSVNPTLVETSTGSGVYKLVTSVKTNNTSSPRTNYIEIVATDPENVAVSAMVQYNQSAIGPTGNDFNFVTTSGYEPKVERGIGSRYTLSCRVAWTNNASTQVTFTEPRFTLALYINATDSTPAYEVTEFDDMHFSDVTVAGMRTLEVDHTATLTGALDVSEYGRIVMTLRTSSITGVIKTYDSSNYNL